MKITKVRGPFKLPGIKNYYVEVDRKRRSLKTTDLKEAKIMVETITDKLKPQKKLITTLDFILDNIEVKTKIELIEGLKSVDINLLFDPPWDKDMMSEEARFELGFM